MASVKPVTVAYLNWVAAVDVRDQARADAARAEREEHLARSKYEDELYKEMHDDEEES